MKYLLLPVAVAAIALFVSVLVPPAHAFWTVATTATAILAIAAMIAAASCFRANDFMRWAWSLSAVPYLTASLSIVSMAVLAPGGPSALTLALSIAGNLLAVLGAALFVLAYLRAGFGFGGLRAPAVVIYAGGFTLALLLGWPIVSASVRGLLAAAEPLQPVLDLLSTASDVGCFLLALPLLRIAFALRGGHLSFTWALLAGTNLSWLIADLAYESASGNAAALVAYRVIFVAANAAGAAAALSHRGAVIAARRAIG